jgi:peptidyl-prolyl cis-trans isomerase B (cyclophilin B)
MAKRRPGTRGEDAASKDEPEGEEAEGPKEQPRAKARRRRERYAKVELKRRRRRMRLIGLGIVVVVAVVLAVAVFMMTRPTEENPVVVIETNKGTIEVELFMDECPVTAGNMKKLVEQGFYNGLTFHRIVNDPGFKIMQGGDPNGDGSGGPDWTIPLEKSATKLKHVRGSLAMARKSDPVDSAGSQFYICGDAIPSLDGDYAVFGKVVSGMDVVDAIINLPTDTNDRPLSEVIMNRVYLKGTDVPPLGE